MKVNESSSLPKIIYSPQDVTHKLKTAIWCSTLTVQKASGFLIHDYLTIKVTLRENSTVTWVDLRLWWCCHSLQWSCVTVPSLPWQTHANVTEAHLQPETNSSPAAWSCTFGPVASRQYVTVCINSCIQLWPETCFMWEHLVIEETLHVWWKILWPNSHL